MPLVNSGVGAVNIKKIKDMIGWIIAAIIWIIGIPVSYSCYIKEWDNSEIEKWGFSAIWPLVLPLYGIYYLHKKV